MQAFLCAYSGPHMHVSLKILATGCSITYFNAPFWQKMIRKGLDNGADLHSLALSAERRRRLSFNRNRVPLGLISSHKNLQYFFMHAYRDNRFSAG